MDFTVTGLNPAEIYYQSPAGSGPYISFASPMSMGLVSGDDIDALAVWDNPGAGTIGIFDPGIDIIYISLTCGSPTAVGMGCASIIDVSPGFPILLYNEADFDLLPNLVDNINGMDFTKFYYLPGDANMTAGGWPPAVIGADVTNLVSYFRGTSQPCNLCGFYASADANGDCQVIGSDVTYLVGYFRGMTNLRYCPDYPTEWPTLGDLPANAPVDWPYCD